MKRTPPAGIESSAHPDWATLWPIEQAIRTAFGGQEAMEEFMATTLRSIIDSVIDTPATGRRSFGELEKTELTYLGTKVEIVLRRRMGFPQGSLMDLSIDGCEVDIKFTTRGAWMIPPEAVGHVMLVIAADDVRGRLWMGLVVADRPKLRGGRNRDAKTSLSAEGWNHIRWLIRNRAYEPNFWGSVPPHLVDYICDASIGGTRRMDRLFRSLPRRVIPRHVLEDVTQQLDFTRRVRANGGARDLAGGDFIILSDWANDAIQALGMPPVPKGAYMGIDVRNPIEAHIINQSNLARTQRTWAARRAKPVGRHATRDDNDEMTIDPFVGTGGIKSD